MKVRKFALIVYFVFTFIAIIANICGNHSVLLLSKPFIVPTIFFYYFITTKKVDVLFSVAIAFSFLGEAIGIMNFSDEIYYMLFPFFICNIILFSMSLKSIRKSKFKIENILVFLVVILLLLYLFWAVVDLFSDANLVLLLEILFYGTSLFLLSCVGIYKLITNMNSSNLNLGIYIICLIISGIFYVIYNFKEKLIVLDIIHFALQMISYYFLVNFKLFQEKTYKIPVVNFSNSF